MQTLKEQAQEPGEPPTALLRQQLGCSRGSWLLLAEGSGEGCGRLQLCSSTAEGDSASAGIPRENRDKEPILAPCAED